MYACDWSPKGNMLVACNSEGSIIVWDAQSGTVSTDRTYRHSNMIDVVCVVLVHSY